MITLPLSDVASQVEDIKRHAKTSTLKLLQFQFVRNFADGTMCVDIEKKNNNRYTLNDVDKLYTVQLLGKDIFIAFLLLSNNITITCTYNAV